MTKVKVRLRPVKGGKPRTRISDEKLIQKCDEAIKILLKTGGKGFKATIPADKENDHDLLFAELVRRFDLLKKSIGVSEFANIIHPIGAVMEVFSIGQQKGDTLSIIVREDSTIVPDTLVDLMGKTYSIVSSEYLPKKHVDSEYMIEVILKEVK